MQFGIVTMVIAMLAPTSTSPPDASVPSGAASPAVWAAQRTPAPGPAQAIGAYSAGCLQGAVSLSPSGPGYEALHLSRRRTFAHPDMVAFIQRLARTAKQQKLGVLIVGDIAQARGGPTPSGHRSHQSGLDVDLGYAAPTGLRSGRLRPGDRERTGPLAVVDLATRQMTRAWGPRTALLLAAAASDPAVDRIFVHPAIKRELCASSMRGATWLARLRPWWGHHDHFHVRLKCPDGNSLCQTQELPAAPADDVDGCGASLAWWFSEDATRTHQQRASAAEQIALPAACTALLDGVGAPVARDGADVAGNVSAR